MKVRNNRSNKCSLYREIKSDKGKIKESLNHNPGFLIIDIYDISNLVGSGKAKMRKIDDKIKIEPMTK